MSDDLDREEPEGAEGFITCGACGTRIRANREYCLRCGQPLAPAPETLDWSSLTSGRGLFMLLAVVAVVVAIGVLIWVNRPTIEEAVQSSTAARQSSVPTPSPPPAAASRAPSSEVSPSPAIAPLDDPEWLDVPRAGTASAAIDDVSLKERLERALSQNPNDADALNELGQAMMRMNDVSNAAARFGRAVDLAPDRGVYHFNLANALARLAQWDRAVHEYREAIRLSQDDYRLHFDLALALHKMGNDQGAIPEYQTASRMAPTDPNVRLGLAISLEKTGRIPAAQAELQQYLKLAESGSKTEAVKAHLDALAAAPAAPSKS